MLYSIDLDTKKRSRSSNEKGYLVEHAKFFVSFKNVQKVGRSTKEQPPELEQQVIIETSINFLCLTKKPVTLIIPVPNPSGKASDIKIADTDIYNDIFHHFSTKEKIPIETYINSLGVPGNNDIIDNFPWKNDIIQKITANKKPETPDPVIYGNYTELKGLLSTVESGKFWISDDVITALQDYKDRHFGFIMIQIMPNMNNKKMYISYTHKIKRRALYIPTRKVKTSEKINADYIYTWNTILNKVNMRSPSTQGVSWVISPVKNEYIINSLQINDIDIDVTDTNTMNTMNQKSKINYLSLVTMSTMSDLLAMDTINNGWLYWKFTHGEITRNIVNANYQDIKHDHTNNRDNIHGNKKFPFTEINPTKIINDRLADDTNIQGKFIKTADPYDPFYFQRDNW